MYHKSCFEKSEFKLEFIDYSPLLLEYILAQKTRIHMNANYTCSLCKRPAMLFVPYILPFLKYTNVKLL